MFSTISMIGLGYIGLPTATLFASHKRHVVGVDISQHAVETINQGKIHIIEPELDILVHAAVTEGYLRATLIPEAADAFVIAVPTPFKDGHKPDLAYIESAAKSIAPLLVKGNLVVLESTSPVGTTEQLAKWLAEARPDLTFPHDAGEDADVQLAYCPERVLPGKVVHELVANDRVIGGLTSKASQMAVDLYKIFVAGKCIVTNARTAEMCKLAENSFRDTNIAFANELSVICEKLGVDVWELISLANLHPRVNILRPGPGVGGHCIAVDPWFIVDAAPEDARIIQMARTVNEHKPAWVSQRVLSGISRILREDPKKNISDVRVACLGLSFKPNIDDLRESPAVQIVQYIAEQGCEVLAVEPHIDRLPKQLQRENLRLVSLGDALISADIICVLVKHEDFEVQAERIRAHADVIDVVGLSV